ncbi:MAG: hypothetical protein L3J53_04325 [Proteobacteria bacterium]|nr:hypothetical protein [Pseudomonadota bacterium]
MKQLPEKIALDKAIHGQRLYQGELEIQQLSRLLDLLSPSNNSHKGQGTIKFSIQFDRVAKLLGKAQVVVNADLPLICTISHKEFIFPVEINSTLGFIDDLEYEQFLEIDMEASWVENGLIKPRGIIEDELILVVPDAPFDESLNSEPEIVAKSIVADSLEHNNDQQSNPFNVLKSLK